MANDPLFQRKHVPVIPEDLNDPPRFSQLVETTMDALVLTLREKFANSHLTIENREEVPTIEKYADFEAGLDPYETFTKIVGEFPDVLERLPHIAVTAITGANSRLTFGVPIIASTQEPPRVTTTVAGPYALANPRAQSVQLTVNALPGLSSATYRVQIDGVEVAAVTMPSGASATQVVAAVARAVDAAAGLLYVVRWTPGAGGAVIITQRDVGEAFIVTASSNLGVTVLVAEGDASAPSQLCYRTTPTLGGPVVESAVIFQTSRFANTEQPGAASAVAVARVFNEQACYAQASVVPVGAGSGIQLTTGGPSGGNKTPNEIEVLPTSSPELVTALGLGRFGVAQLGDSITGEAPQMVLHVAAVDFTGLAGFVTLAGQPTTANNGRWPIVSAGVGVLAFTNPAGVPEAFVGSWFVGARDDSTNPARPVMNRYHISMSLQVTLDILAESPNERREATDIVLALFCFGLELQFFTMYGRGIFDEAYPDEHYQISIHQEVQNGGQQEFPRGEDQKNKIHASRVVVPVSIRYFLDRPVLTPSGPSAGRSWVLDSSNVTYDESLTQSS